MFSEVWTRFVAKFGPNAIAESMGKLIPKLFGALLVAVLFLVVWFVVRRVLDAVLDKMELDKTLKVFIKTVTRSIIAVLAIVSALSELGIDTASLLTSLGVAGLTLGFAAKDTLSNLISGLFIFWDRPFVIGDLVEINGQYGKVENITLRSTRVVTVDGKMIALPNAMVVNSAVTSYTNFPSIRLGIDVTLGVEEDLERSRALFLQLVNEDDRFMDTPAPKMAVVSLNDYNVAVQFQVWLKDESTHIAVRQELREKLFNTLRDAKIDMPFQTLVVHQSSMATPSTQQDVVG